MKAFRKLSSEIKKTINEISQNNKRNDYHRKLCEELDIKTQEMEKEIFHRNITEKGKNSLILEDRPVDRIHSKLQMATAKDFFESSKSLELVYDRLSRVHNICNLCQEHLSMTRQDLQNIYRPVQACRYQLQTVQEILEKESEKHEIQTVGDDQSKENESSGKRIEDEIQMVDDDQSMRNEQSGEQTRDQINMFVHSQLAKLNKALKEMAETISPESQSSKISNSDATANLENMHQLYRQSEKLIQNLNKFDLETLKADLIKADANILNQYFRDSFFSRLKKEHITVPPDLRDSFDRHMDIKQVRSKCGDEAARIFAALKGEIVMIKSEGMSYNENITKKSRDQYEIRAVETNHGIFQVNAKFKKVDKYEFEGVVNLNNHTIEVQGAKRTDSQSLQLSQILGEIWLHSLLNVAKGKDDDNHNIDYIFRTKPTIKQIKHKLISNGEVIDTLALFIKEAKGQKGTFKTKIGTKSYLAILGTPNGHNQQYLLKEYKHYLGNRKITNIEVEYEFDKNGRLFIDEIRFHINEKPISS
jgi:hypothetical protein